MKLPIILSQLRLLHKLVIRKYKRMPLRMLSYIQELTGGPHRTHIVLSYSKMKTIRATATSSVSNDFMQ
ncbi:hypothetical protein CCR75_008171 [Bremia lactucae]|uniref:Uncharacterized protein n=1 Tax=Bremia lactucae TaxID=4779 RepID=A0A976IES0_BRELC|nr:hypothetical protein CCR75_008171 [Bremia lactucae]